MEEWVKEIVEAEKEKRNVPPGVKVLNRNYYLYHSTIRWGKRVKI